MRMGVGTGEFGFLRGGGELAELIAAFDWSTTALGPISGWPPHLKTSVGLALRSAVPIVMLWGEDGVMIYNDAYSVFAGGRHPQLLGSKVREGWPEVADFNDNVMKVGAWPGETLAYRDQELTLESQRRTRAGLHESRLFAHPGRHRQARGRRSPSWSRPRPRCGGARGAGERERMRQMFAQAPGFMAMLERPGARLRPHQRAYMQLIGHRDVIGQAVREALPEIEGQGFYELLDQVYASGEPFIGQALKVWRAAYAGQCAEERFVDLDLPAGARRRRQRRGHLRRRLRCHRGRDGRNAVRESDAQFRSFAEAMPNHVWTSPPTVCSTGSTAASTSIAARRQANSTASLGEHRPPRRCRHGRRRLGCGAAERRAL